MRNKACTELREGPQRADIGSEVLGASGETKPFHLVGQNQKARKPMDNHLLKEHGYGRAKAVGTRQ